MLFNFFLIFLCQAAVVEIFQPAYLHANQWLNIVFLVTAAFIAWWDKRTEWK